MHKDSVVVAVLLIAVGGVVTPLRAQPATPDKPQSFEVASVRRNMSGSLIVNHTIEGNRYTGTNLSVKDLLTAVYAPLPRARIVGGPNWINTDRFDIIATAENVPTHLEAMQMVRSLLVERFQLVVHSEARLSDVYDLVVAKSAAELGPMLRPPAPDCAVAAPDWNKCLRAVYAGKLLGAGVTIDDLAYMLEPFTEQRTVRNRTGLTGRYDVQLTWTPDRLGPLPPNAPEAVIRAREAIDPNGPALSTALQEQLGLKLEARKDTVDVVVIDRLEHPAEN
jgi:uncharacterized protein (TIGR03435 family)